MKTLTFYFALRSPYSALASDIVHEAASSGDYDGRVNFRLAPFSNLVPGFSDPASNPLKLQYMMHDLPRLYAARGLAIAVPDPFDLDFSIPARMVLAAQEDGVGLAYLRSLSLMRWCDGRNVAEEDSLLEAADRSGWSAQAATEALADPGLQQRYDDAVMASQEAGVFGVPFFIVTDGDNSEPFWGQDRWPMVRDALESA